VTPPEQAEKAAARAQVERMRHGRCSIGGGEEGEAVEGSLVRVNSCALICDYSY
jgi:hypothetical protein